MDFNDEFDNFENKFERFDAPIENDWEKENFYAITDGGYGSYEDFIANGGDLQYLMDCLGF